MVQNCAFVRKTQRPFLEIQRHFIQNISQISLSDAEWSESAKYSKKPRFLQK
jgi:hypothetical protein